MTRLSSVILMLITLLGTQALQADVKLNRVFGNHMVLQQNQPIRIFGTANPGEKITVKLANQAAVAMANSDSNGGMLSRWSEPVRIAPNGRAMDATVRVQGSRDFHIDVSLRGLTGMASYSSPQRAVPATQNASTEDESDELTLKAGVNSGGLQ